MLIKLLFKKINLIIKGKWFGVLESKVRNVVALLIYGEEILRKM